MYNIIYEFQIQNNLDTTINAAMHLVSYNLVRSVGPLHQMVRRMKFLWKLAASLVSNHKNQLSSDTAFHGSANGGHVLI